MCIEAIGLSYCRVELKNKELILTHMVMDCCSFCEKYCIEVFVLTVHVYSLSVAFNGIVAVFISVFTVTFILVHLCNC